MFKKLVIGVALLIMLFSSAFVAPGISAAPMGAPAYAAQTVFSGSYFGQVRDSKGIHNYVVFNTNGMRRDCWRITAPWGYGWTSPGAWPQVSSYYVQAGFHWWDNVSPYRFLKPADFKLYPC